MHVKKWLPALFLTLLLMLPFGDGYSSNLEKGYARWGGKEKVRDYITGILRKYRPSVVVTHDIQGEYGHGAHKVLADAAIWCVQHAADPSVYPASAEAFGVFDVPKLYLHLYEQNPIVLNWRVPDKSLDGRTPLQAAQDAYAFHVTQQNAGTAVIGKDFEVTDDGEFACNQFGLYRSIVGSDTGKNDFFENIP